MSENKISPIFTENELKNIAVDSMGKASEAGAAAIRIFGLATNTKANGEIIYTAGNKSSSTIGFFQWDIGAKENGQEFIDAYNKWANVHDKTNVITEDEIPDTILRLHQNRNTALPLVKMDIRKDELGEKFNTFFASQDGEQFIMELQKQQYELYRVYRRGFSLSPPV